MARSFTRSLAFMVIGAVVMTGPAWVPARAQQGVSDPSLDNLKHPPGTATAPLGELGRVDKIGNGPVALILIPGAAFGGGIWKDFMERNKNDYTMYAVTPAGYEGTNPPPWPEGNDFTDYAWTAALCNAVAKLIDEEKLDRAVIVGHHMIGDHYALRIALDHPNKIRGAVVVSGMPSMVFATSGQPSPGQPARPASLKQRRKVVSAYFVPFYKTVTQKMWNAGTYQPRVLCRDAARGAQLYQQQISVPIPTQLRYFFEFETADLEPELAKLGVPLLVVLPKTQWTQDVVLDNFRESNEIMFGSAEKAKAGWTQRLAGQWGDVQEGVKWQYDWHFRWDRLRGVVPNLTIKSIENSGIFIMDDQPQAFDRELKSFVAGLR